MTNNWFLGTLWGVLCIVLGFVAMANPFAASLAVEILVAWMFVLMGIVVIVSAFMGDETNGRIWSILLGVMMIILGIVMFRNPLAGILALSMVVAVFALIAGGVKIVAGWRIRDNLLKWLTVISGVASVILAFVIMSNPAISLGILLAVELIFDGVALIGLSLARRRGGVSAS